jgi:hypothetical protein
MELQVVIATFLAEGRAKTPAFLTLQATVMTIRFPETPLIAGPPPANPPIFLAVLIILVSLSGPYLFAAAGVPNLFLAVASAALAIAGIITALAAAAAQKRRRADLPPRPRAHLAPTGITFLPTAISTNKQIFPRDHIAAVQLLPRALIVDTIKPHPQPGRHRLMFGPPLLTPHEALTAAIEALNNYAKQNIPPPG